MPTKRATSCNPLFPPHSPPSISNPPRRPYPFFPKLTESKAMQTGSFSLSCESEKDASGKDLDITIIILWLSPVNKQWLPKEGRYGVIINWRCCWYRKMDSGLRVSSDWKAFSLRSCSECFRTNFCSLCVLWISGRERFPIFWFKWGISYCRTSSLIEVRKTKLFHFVSGGNEGVRSREPKRPVFHFVSGN